MPTGSDTAEFAFSFRGTSETIAGRYGYGLALLGVSDNLLAGVAYDGDGTPVGRVKMFGSAGPNNAAAFQLAPKKQWHNILVRGVWQSDGSAQLFFYVDPTATTDVNAFGATLNLNIGEDISKIQIRSGDFNNVTTGKAIWDDIVFRVEIISSAQTIPEPASATIVMLGLLSLASRRRRCA